MIGCYFFNFRFIALFWRRRQFSLIRYIVPDKSDIMLARNLNHKIKDVTLKLNYLCYTQSAFNEKCCTYLIRDCCNSFQDFRLGFETVK